MRRFVVFSLIFLLVLSPSAPSMELGTSSLGTSSSAWSDSDKAVEAVKDFIAKNNPEWSDGEIVVTLKGAEGFIKKYSGRGVEFEIPKDYRLTRITPRIILPLRAKKDGVEVKRTTIYALVEVYKDVVVAKQKIKKGAVFTQKDLMIKEADVSLYPNKYFADLNGLEGKISKSLIPQGSVIFSWMVKTKPLVKKGNRVRILVLTPEVQLEAQGFALEDGQLDEVIKIKRENSKRVLNAVVISSSEVEVRI